MSFFEASVDQIKEPAVGVDLISFIGLHLLDTLFHSTTGAECFALLYPALLIRQVTRLEVTCYTEYPTPDWGRVVGYTQTLMGKVVGL